MIDITNKSYLKYILFASLYFSEGLKWAIAVVILPIYFDDLGISPTIIGLAIAIAGIPVMIKFIFGGIVDFFIKFGRKKFVLIGGLTASISLLIAGFINPADMMLLFILILFIGITGISFLDVAADAWAIETTKKHERGRVNGAMFTGIFIGMSVGSFLFTQIAERFNYSAVFFVAGIMTFLIVLFPLSVKEIKKIVKRKKISKVLLNEFRKKNVQIFSIFTPVAAISGGLLLIVIPLYMKKELMLGVAHLGLIAAIFPITNIFGSIFGGLLSDEIGRKYTIYLVFSLSIVFSSLLIFASTWQILSILYAIIGFLFGAVYSTIGALAMDITNPKIAATQFSIFMGLLNIGEVGIGNGLAGFLLDSLGYRRVFLYSGLIYGWALLIIYTFKIKKTKNNK